MRCSEPPLATRGNLPEFGGVCERERSGGPSSPPRPRARGRPAAAKPEESRGFCPPRAGPGVPARRPRSRRATGQPAARRHPRRLRRRGRGARLSRTRGRHARWPRRSAPPADPSPDQRTVERNPDAAVWTAPSSAISPPISSTCTARPPERRLPPPLPLPAPHHALRRSPPSVGAHGPPWSPGPVPAPPAAPLPSPHNTMLPRTSGR